MRGILSQGILGSTPSGWTVLVISANDLRGGTGFPFFDKHVKADQINEASGLASSATVDSDGVVQFQIPDATYPWTRDEGAPSSAFYWPFAPSTWNMNNGHPEDNFRTAGRPSHNGMDMGYGIANVTDTPIRAVADGTVQFVGVDGSYGNRIVIQHDNGIRTTYNHMHNPSPLAMGDHVHMGDVVGGIGTTGGSTGNHLHFEVFDQSIGDYVDPLDFMAAVNPSNKVIGVDPIVPDIEVYVPRVTSSPMSTIDGVAAGGGVYLFTPEGFAQYMTIMQGAPWVLSGISDIRLVPSWAVGGGGDATFTAQEPPTDPGSALWSVANIPVFRAEVVSATASPTVLNNWRATVLGALDAGYYRKLLTSPFTDLLVGNGENIQSFRPDQWDAAGLSFQAVTGAAHGDPSIRLIPTGYNDLGSQLGVSSPVGGQGGRAMSGYGLAASQVAATDLSPYLAAFSSHQTWLVALRNKQLAQTLGYTEIQLNAGVQGIQTVLAGAGGAISGAAGGAGGMGALGGAVGSTVGNLATAGITASNTITMLDASQYGSFDITAYQMGLSGLAAVTSFDTWYQSLKSSSGHSQPESLASAWRAIIGQAFRAIVAVPSAERVRALLSEWGRYGYMIGQAFVPPRMDPMTHYSFWQISDATILGRLPQDARVDIASAFQRGVTVWNSVAEIGTEPANAPRAGVSY